MMASENQMFGVKQQAPGTVLRLKDLTTKNGELKVKTAIVSMLLVAAIVGPSNAGNGLIVERPCWNKCSNPAAQTQRATHLSGTGNNNAGSDTSTIRSQTVIHSRYGTSVINGTYRSYSR